MDCLLKDFNKHGRLALIPLIAMHLMAWPMNMYMVNAPLFSEANYLNLIAITLVIIGYKTTRLTWKSVAATTYLIFLTYAVLFVWSRPGNSILEKFNPSDDPRFEKPALKIPDNPSPTQ